MKIYCIYLLFISINCPTGVRCGAVAAGAALAENENVQSSIEAEMEWTGQRYWAGIADQPAKHTSAVLWCGVVV